MEQYKKKFSDVLADSGALFFKDGLFLKDGRPTPHFVNIGGFAEKASYRLDLARAYSGMIKNMIDGGNKVDIVFGPSYKASLIAGDVTMSLLIDHAVNLGCCYDRKEAKTHGEASGGESLFVGAKFFDGCNIYIVDDVGTSMATKVEALDKIAAESKAQGITTKVVGIGIAVDREQVGPVYDSDVPKELKGKELDAWKRGHVVIGARGDDAIGNFVRRTGTPVNLVVGITEVVEHLFESQHPLKINGVWQAMDDNIHNQFLEYMQTYGARR